MSNNTANRPSQSHLEYVTNSRGEKVRNLAYKGNKNKTKDSSINDFSSDFNNIDTDNVDYSDVAPYSDKELKEMYRDELDAIWNGNQSMVDHCLKSSTGYIMVGGKIIPFEKPSVKKNFYYAEHGYDFDDVQDTISKVSKDEEYFIRQNIEESTVYLDLERLKSARSDDNSHYITIEERYSDSEVGYLKYNTPNSIYKNGDEYDPTTDRKLDEDALDALIEKSEEELSKFEKRLKTYLKRYGLSKTTHSSFWADK